MDDRGIPTGVPSIRVSKLTPAKIQPRLVLVLLLSSSFAGIWLSHRGNPVLIRVVWWIVIVSNGVLVGGLYWRLVLFDSPFLENSNTIQRIRIRWRYLETLAIWSFFLLTIVNLGSNATKVSIEIGMIVLTTGAVLSLIFWFSIYRDAVVAVSGRTTLPRILLFLSALFSLAGFAWMETGASLIDWIVRFSHIASFALWIGGAFWHNFLILPVIRSPAITDAVKRQTRRFRRHLPIVIPVLFVTGGYQALQLVELSFPLFLNSTVGQLVGSKFLILLTLSGMVFVNLRQTASPH